MTARLRVVEGGDVPIVRIAGEVDLANARAIGAEIMAYTPNSALGLVLDLAETTYLDSQGVNLVLHLATRLAAHGQELRVAVPAGSHVRRVLAIAHVDKHVPLDVAAAEAAERVLARHRQTGGDGAAAS